MATIIEITDFTAPELDVYARLTEAQLRNRRAPEQGIFIAESPNVIALALAAGCVPISLLMERKQIAGQAAGLIACCGDIPVYTAERSLLTALTGFSLTRGILCAMHRPQLPDAIGLCSHARRIAVLDGIVDSTNVGAIFRSAAALNIDAVLLSQTCCDPLCRRSVRVSMGAVFQVPWARIPQELPQSGLPYLQKQGFRTVAMALSDTAIPIDAPQLTNEDKLAIVLGTEGTGLSSNTIAHCDYTVCIPMSHGVDSLNVATAAAIAFWQLRAR